jgi:hypothetical protein
LLTYSAARTRIKRNLPGLQEEIYIILEKVTDEIRNRVAHFDDPFSLLDDKSIREKSDDQEYLTKEYEKIEKNSYHFISVEGINSDSLIADNNGEFKPKTDDKAKNVTVKTTNSTDEKLSIEPNNLKVIMSDKSNESGDIDEMIIDDD